MKTRIYCKTIAKGQQAFYLVADNKEYYLFTQNYRISVRDYFGFGISIQESTKYSNVHSTAVRNTLDKLKAYIPYIEKEYGIAVMTKTKKQREKRRNKPYKRDTANWKNFVREEMALYACC